MTVFETDSDSISVTEKQFILDLIRDARLNGILEIEYKSLRLKLSPLAADNAHRQTYMANVGGASGSWSTQLPKAVAK